MPGACLALARTGVFVVLRDALHLGSTTMSATARAIITLATTMAGIAVRRRHHRRTAPQSLANAQAMLLARAKTLATQRRRIRSRVVQNAIRVVRYRMAMPAARLDHVHLAFAVVEDAAVLKGGQPVARSAA